MMMSDSIQNVAVVVIDALRADRIGAEVGRDLTPNIDSLASDGIVFENAFSCTNATDPAMTSLMTGRFPYSHGIIHHGSHVTDQEKARVDQLETLGTDLKNEGYRTIKTGRLMGRWHVRGFDKTPSDRRTTSKYANSWKGLVLEGISKNARTARWTRRVGIQRRLDAIEQWIEGPDSVDRLLKAINGEPFFGLVHLLDVHAAYEPDYQTEKSIQKRKDGETMGEIIKRFEGSLRAEQLYNTFIRGRAETEHSIDVGDIIRKYDATVVEADKKVGKLVQGLKEAGVYDTTLIIVLSDHGESLDEHGIYFDHHGLYDQSIRIPLILSHPDLSPSQITNFVQITDIAPTILDLVDIKGEIDPDGDSFEPLIKGDEWDRPNIAFAMEKHTTHRRAVRTTDWKYIELATGDTTCRYCNIEHGPAEQLFNIESDPEEAVNLANEREDKQTELSECIESFVSACDPPPVIDENVKYDDEAAINERLKALGYR